MLEEKDKNRLSGIYKILEQYYGYQGWWPIYDPEADVCVYVPERGLDEQNRFEIALGAILTQNVAWTNVEKAIRNLHFAGMLDPHALADAEPEIIADCIRPAGYYNQKTKTIKNFLNFLALYNYSISNIGNNGEESRKLLLSLKGIGPETADSICLYALNFPLFVIDAYTRRLLSRMDLIKGKESYEILQILFHRCLDSDTILFKEYHALIVALAKDYCRKKPLCKGCPLFHICPKVIL